MARVLQAMAGAIFGGAESFFTRLVIALHKVGVPQHVIVRTSPYITGILEAHGLFPIELQFRNALDVRSYLSFRREIASFHPDIVLTWMNRATQFCPRGEFVHVGRLGGYYNLKYYRHCNHLICNTLDIVDYVVQNGWPLERVHYLPNFASEERCTPVNRIVYCTPNDAPLLLALGRLHENKGFDVLLKAMVQIPNIYLWIAGEGPKRAELEALAAQLAVKQRVHFLGWRSDVASLFASADLFICPSKHEPLGNVILEAWAQKLPVIATASEGPRILIRNLENGILVPVDDVLALAHAIRHVLFNNTLRQRIAAGGRKSFETTFTESAVVTRYQTFFKEIKNSCAVSAE